MADIIVSLVHDGFDIGADDAEELGWQDRAECLEYALEHDERFGIWGGLSERERRRLKREAV